MPREARHGPWEGVQRAGAVALVVVSLLVLFLRARAPETPFIRQSTDDPWIAAPLPVSAQLAQWGREATPLTRFERRFEVSRVGTDATLELRALRHYEVSINGGRVGASAPDSGWREVSRFDVAAALRPGENTLRVDVFNRHGPALLQLRLSGLDTPIVAGPAFATAIDGVSLGPAVRADDTRINPLAFTVETPVEALADHWPVALLLALLGAGLFVGVRRARPEGPWADLPRWALAAAGLGWLYLFVFKFTAIPLEVGFDARHHLYYVEFLRERWAVPYATDGWSVYHPPLFYAAATLLGALGRAIAGYPAEVLGIKLLPALAGLGNVWVAAALCGRLFPGDPRARFLAALFAAVLPVNLYSAAYFSNETLHTLVSGIALLLTVDLLQARRVSTSELAKLSAVLGIALVTKFTAILVAAVAGFFVACRLLILDRAPPLRVARSLLLLGLGGVVFAGWFYLRNWLRYGDPLMANWGNMPGPGLDWWQQPGFHTLAYFTSVGDGLVYPYLAGFQSFWDSLYTTLWGDGGIGGRVSPVDRPGFWNYELMSAGYLVALPATGLAAYGCLRCLRIALTDADSRRRAAFSFLLTFAYAVIYGLVYMALRLPYFAQAKASYGLVIMAPLSVFFAVGAGRVDALLADRGWHAARAVAAAWLGTFVGLCFFAYAA